MYWNICTLLAWGWTPFFLQSCVDNKDSIKYVTHSLEIWSILMKYYGTIFQICQRQINDANFPFHHIPKVFFWIEICWLSMPFQFNELIVLFEEPVWDECLECAKKISWYYTISRRLACMNCSLRFLFLVSRWSSKIIDYLLHTFIATSQCLSYFYLSICWKISFDLWHHQGFQGYLSTNKHAISNVTSVTLLPHYATLWCSVYWCIILE